MYGSRNSQPFSIIKNTYFKNIFTVFYCFISLMTVFAISKYSLILSQYCFVIFKFTFLLFLQWFFTVIWKHIFLKGNLQSFVSHASWPVTYHLCDMFIQVCCIYLNIFHVDLSVLSYILIKYLSVTLRKYILQLRCLCIFFIT